MLFSWLAMPAAAQQVLPCDWQARADTIVEPWEDHTRTFANGDVRVALLDVIEPALGSYYLLVLSPPFDEVGGRQCRVIGFDGGVGFTFLEFDTISADYSAERGVELQMLGRIAAPEYDFTNAVNLWVIINQSSGEISTFMELGSE
jgi:hypothetical protein